MKSVLQLEERLGFLLSAAACQYLLPVRSKSQFLEKYSEIPPSTLFREVLPVTGAHSRLEATAMVRRRPNIIDSFNSTVPAKQIPVMRDLNYSNLTLCGLQTVATARGKVYQVNILVVCSPSKVKEDSQHNSDSEECP